MLQDTNNVPTLKAIEEALFRHLQNCFQTVLLKVLEDIDVWLMENRDHKRNMAFVYFLLLHFILQ